ncbi:MAG: hypothetical protein ABIO38_07610 [Luteimonas sp.]
MFDASKRRLPFAPGPILVFALAVLAITWRFLPWMPSVFYGDDLDYLLLFEDGQCATTLSEILTATCYERFRPVASSVVMALMAIADHDINYHLVANVALHGLIATMVYVISQRLSGGRRVVSVALALAVALSRLATYQVTQMIGPVESITLLSALVAVHAALRADARVVDAWRWGWIAIAAAFVAMHTHERSMVLAAWLAVVFALSPTVRSLPRARWLALLAGCVALPVFYVSYKTLVLHTYLLVGTGGTHVELQSATIVEHLWQASRSLLAFNTGPDYLAGRNVTGDWRIAWGLAMVFACTWIGSIAWGVRQAFDADGVRTDSAWSRLRWLLWLLMLAGALLVPALLTVRLEQRWLLAPFVIGLLVVAWAAGMVPRDRRHVAITILAVVLACASFAVDTAVMRHYDRLFFISSPRFAAQVKRDVVDAAPRRTGDVALLAGADQCNWTLFRGGFFRIYGGMARKVHCFVTLDEARRAGLPDGTHIYGPEGPDRLTDLTAKPIPVVQGKRLSARVDFLDEFARGHISDTMKMQTPTGQGALVMQWDARDGVRQTLTVLSGFTYRYDDIAVEAGEVLRFGVGMIYPAPQSARAIVRIGLPGQPVATIYSEDLKQPLAGAKPAFIGVALPLEKYAGQRVTVSFAVESPGKDSTAHWIGFAEPSIGEPDR